MKKKFILMVVFVLMLVTAVTAYNQISDQAMTMKRINDIYYARSYVTGGSGTASDPYTGWQSSVFALLNSSQVSIAFTKGYYACDVAYADPVGRKFCLRLGSNSSIIGTGRAWITQTAGLNLNAFIIDASYFNHLAIPSYNVHVENLNFFGNTATAYGGNNGTANPIAMLNVHDSVITNIYGENYGNYATIWLQGTGNTMSATCANAVRSGGYFQGHCIWITGVLSTNNNIISAVGHDVSNILELEDYAGNTNVGLISGKNIDGAGAALINAYNVNINSINVENGTRGILLSQGTRFVNVGQMSLNSTTQGLYSHTCDYIHVGGVSMNNVDTGFSLTNSSNISASNAQFHGVTTKIDKTGSNTGLFIQENGNVIDGSFTVESGDITIGDNDAASNNLNLNGAANQQKCVVYKDAGTTTWQVCDKASSSDLFWYNGDYRMTMQADGDVGIGTDPTARLHVTGGDVQIGTASSSGHNLIIDSGAGEQKCLHFKDAGVSNWQICDQASSSSLFWYNGDFRLRMTSGGELNLQTISGDGTGKVVCIKADGNLGTCTDAVGAGGTCTCA